MPEQLVGNQEPGSSRQQEPVWTLRDCEPLSAVYHQMHPIENIACSVRSATTGQEGLERDYMIGVT